MHAHPCTPVPAALAGEPERAKAVMRGHGVLDDEWGAALAALDEDAVRRLQVACHAALGYLQSERA